MNRTINYAMQSECRQRHAALITKSGRVMGWATNKYYNDPSMFSSELLTKEREMISVHAEVKAMRGVSSDQLIGSTIYIARVMPRGNTALSKPCKHCQKALDKAGVRKVVYTYS